LPPALQEITSPLLCWVFLLLCSNSSAGLVRLCRLLLFSLVKIPYNLCGANYRKAMQANKQIDNEALREIRNNTDWKRLFDVLNLEKDPKKSTENDWWAKSPFTEETKPSFHINDNGFYCFSTKEKGGPIELVQAYFRHRMGQTINCYEAGRWLLENNVSSLSGSEDRSEEKKIAAQIEHLKEKIEETKLENKPIRQNLVPVLTQLGEHPEFVRRGISEKTCKYLGCGYLENAKGEMKDRIIFQVRGVQVQNNGDLSPVILTHVGRATNEEQEAVGGKWKPYKGFIKTLEVYNIDKALLDPEAIDQAVKSGKILIVEGCFDVAKLVEAGIKNVIATFGSYLAEEQIPRLKLIKEMLGDVSFLVWYDHDKAGSEGQEKALELLKTQELSASGFDWDISFPSAKRGSVKIPASIKDACEFSVEQLKWLRENKII